MGASEIVVALIGLVGVAVGGIIAGLFAQRKNTAEAELAATEAERLKQEITDAVLERARLNQEKMNTQITDLEDEINKLNEHISTLNEHIKRQDRKIERQRQRILDLERENQKYVERIRKLESGTGPLSEH